MNHLELLDVATLDALAGVGGDAIGPCVSLYMPMVKSGTETRQNPIRFKNMLGEARRALDGMDLSDGDIDTLLAPAKAHLEDRGFFEHQETGLALLLAPGKAYALRLPLAFEELCVVTHRFHLKPLFPMLTGDGTYHVLALSRNAVRLFECSRHAVRERALGDGVPRSLVDALGHETTEKRLQSHSPQQGTSIFHGQGGGTDDEKAEVRKFLKLVDDGIQPLLQRDGPARPLVIAAVDALAALFREVSDHRAIVEQPLAGNPEQLSAEQLHERAWPLVEPIFARALDEQLERYGVAISKQQYSNDIEGTVIAAIEGRIDTLFIAGGVRRWGRVDALARTVTEEDASVPGNEDLLDRAAVATFLNGGAVFRIEPERVPGDGPLAAIHRY